MFLCVLMFVLYGTLRNVFGHLRILSDPTKNLGRLLKNVTPINVKKLAGILLLVLLLIEMRRHVRIFVPGAALACAQTLFYFSFRSSQNHRRAREKVITRAPTQDGVFDEIDDFKFSRFYLQSSRIQF